MRGVILAGGTGSRLWPLTKSINKHLLPVFDKPLIHYPLSTLMHAGIKEVMIVSSPEHIVLFQNHFGDGSQLGMEISYGVQKKPGGLPQGVLVAEDFIENENFALILGDNIFHGVGLGYSLRNHSDLVGAEMICYQVSDPERFGVVEFKGNKVLSLEEKPLSPKSNFAITGLYFFDAKAPKLTRNLKPSPRGELEIVDLLREYLKLGELSFEILPRGSAWLDTGTPTALLDAANYISVLETRQGLKVGCIEEISWRNGWITKRELLSLVDESPNLDFKRYIHLLISE